MPELQLTQHCTKDERSATGARSSGLRALDSYLFRWELIQGRAKMPMAGRRIILVRSTSSMRKKVSGEGEDANGRKKDHPGEKHKHHEGKYKVTPVYEVQAAILLWEHNLLSEAFINVTACPGIECKKQLLISLLNPLNKIWTQPEWAEEYMSYTYRLSGLLCIDQFMETIRLLVKSFKEIKGRKIEHSTGTQEKGSPTSTAIYPHSSTFAQLMLALLLRAQNSNRRRELFITGTGCLEGN